jgi:hypothetical protein
MKKIMLILAVIFTCGITSAQIPKFKVELIALKFPPNFLEYSLITRGMNLQKTLNKHYVVNTGFLITDKYKAKSSGYFNNKGQVFYAGINYYNNLFSTPIVKPYFHANVLYANSISESANKYNSSEPEVYLFSHRRSVYAVVAPGVDFNIHKRIAISFQTNLNIGLYLKIVDAEARPGWIDIAFDSNPVHLDSEIKIGYKFYKQKKSKVIPL